MRRRSSSYFSLRESQYFVQLLQSGGYLSTKVLMAHLSVQASMSLLGYDVPLGKSATDKARRREVFEIIHPYIMSPADMEEVEEAGVEVKDLSLESFTATQKGMLGTTLSYYTKQYFQYFFPSKGLIPNNKYGYLVDRRSCNGKL